MKEQEFRKLVREEIKNLLTETTKGNIISQIYQWIIQGDMEKAMTALKYDPELVKLANNVEKLKNELLKRMAKDETFQNYLSDFLKNYNDGE